MMLTEELGLTLNGPSPLRAAAFYICCIRRRGYCSFLPFILHFIMPNSVVNPFLWSTFLRQRHFSVSGLRNLGLSSRVGCGLVWRRYCGGAAAVIAYFVGKLLGGLV